MSIFDQDYSRMAIESFMLIDIAYTVSRRTGEPVIHLAGKITSSNSPITIEIQGFYPYFFVEFSDNVQKVISQNIFLKN